MKSSPTLIVTLVSALAIGCGDGAQPGATVDAPSRSIDAPAAGATLPTWMLTDVQPASPRTGQTYGLQTFAGKIIVVSLLEGF